MKSKVLLKAVRRDVTGKKVKQLRIQGQLPAVMYGKGVESVAIALDAREATRILQGTSSSTLVSLDIQGVKHTALVRERQYDVLLGTLLHVDFHALSMVEVHRSNVRIRLVGEAPVLSAYEAMLMTRLNTIKVEALPTDLPERIDIDVTSLAEIGDSIRVRDLQLGDKVVVSNPPDDVIVIAASVYHREEEDEDAEEPTMIDAEPEVVSRGKKEDEEEE